MELNPRDPAGLAQPTTNDRPFPEKKRSGARMRPSSPDPMDRWESDVVLKNGSTLHLRPVRPDDAPGVLDFVNRLSTESLYFRFLSIPSFDRTKAEYLARVDYENQFALVGETREGIVALGHFYRSARSPERAEAAFAVADSLQGQGIGTSLLDRLARIAREKQITTFEAEVLPDNQRMIEVFLNSGFEVKQRMEEGVLRFELSLAPTAAVEERAAERARHAATASMQAFFEPRSVAVVGADRKRGRIGSEILHNLRATGFRGRIVAVNPHASSIQTVRCYPRVTEIPGEVDLAVIVVPAARVESVVDDCLAKGVKALVVISAGFSETGEAGRASEAALVEKIRAAGIRMIGPNCMGILNTDPKVRLNATFSPVYPPEGRVGMLSQSGALGLAILDYARRLNLGISTFVSVGNKPDVSGNDLILYWEKDPRTDVILLYLESFGNPQNFGPIARRVSRSKPIVVVKAGRSPAGSRAASSHTGALAESDAVVEALLRQSGVIRTRTLEELFDAAMLLAHQPLPSGRRVAILTNAGGPGILAADACESLGLSLASLSKETATALRAFLPAEASVGNPIDLLASAPAEHYRRAVHLVLADPGVDSLIVIFIPPLVTAADTVAAAVVAEAGGSSKPVLATFMGAKGAPPGLSPIPCYPFPESAAAALSRATEYAEWRRKPASAVPEFADVHADEARDFVAHALERGEGWLTPAEARSVLTAFGIPVARSRVAPGWKEIRRAAKEIGFPVALKAIGPTLIHKTDVGGVKLDLANSADLRRAFRELELKLGDRVTSYLVQEMVPGGVEVIVGAVFDRTFGPLVLYGSGGTLVELLGDAAFRIAPLTEADASDMLNEVKGTARLRGFRGAPPADEKALTEVLLRVSALLEACPEIQEMDLNPVKIFESGVRAVDFRIRVGRRPPPARARRISY
ncbi:MAG TPA: GNAT family N-acetyltransferase [Thermoanaerobaculia bacterium]|jgi:acetyl coenzyme A synthetase (ADP forming)-like protein